MMNRIIIFLVGFLLIGSASAKSIKLEQHKVKAKGGYNYWLSLPSDTAAKKPAIMFLHGASLCGSNMEKVKRYGPLDAQAKGREIDAYIIAPQNPGGSWNPRKVKNVLDKVMAEHNVDSTRIYVIGMSLGGYGTLDFVASYPDNIAAAVALCGGATVDEVGELNKVPLWIVHGTADRAIPIAQSDKVVRNMQKSDSLLSRLVYNRVEGMNHGRPARMFYLPEMYDWLFSHSLEDEGRPVSEPVEINDATLRSAYKGLKTTATKKRVTRKKTSYKRKRR